MSIDINWDAFTAGPDGAALALQIRDFIHDKFQCVALPKFIQSVEVISFDFGSVAPDVEIRGIGDPFVEFYEDDDESDEEQEGRGEQAGLDGEMAFEDDEEGLGLEREMRRRLRNDKERERERGDRTGGIPPPPPPLHPQHQIYQYPHQHHHNTQHRSPGMAGFRSASDSFRQGGVSTPLFPFSTPTTSNLHFFHSALSSGFSGAATPTASLPFQSPHHYQHSYDHHHVRRRGGSSPSSSPSSSLSSLPSPSSSPRLPPHHLPPPRSPTPAPPPPPRRPRASSDIQITARVKYTGDIRIELTTELLLDYPARSFVSLPVRLVVTGMAFDGVACVAWIGRRLHFCFLEEEATEDLPANFSTTGVPEFQGGMLKEIKVESEIGEKGKGKQVLKNVGKVERFVLEQVRRIFEEEFVFPSTWTFLV
ncbi:hypothetical protein L211DRAFT_787916 [Terfezia boudieri ATCC MYA-4762]|uniref:Mitochondrial distribution and morphology protein 12 n=1 Tax=Terfezia boudieri ATCC MYA-4762 TaxID=1051890 RepID=A0A3N4LQ47_9PEZI|nr:hypothetical protein L211DRAFT_787916 [Terfezia boudieri ATCC MYA-4762]